MVKTMSQLKNVVVIAAAMFIYGDEVSSLEMIGYAIATAGFIAFNQAKSLDNAKVREMVAERARRASSVDETERLVVVEPSTTPSARATDTAL
jgi:Triose-phosphate Transporter family.